MENPEVCSATHSSGRESLAEGSGDLEKLLQTAESENLQMVKLIDTERQRSTEFQKQIEEAIANSETLEESTKNLDVEAKQLHNKFKQNREICEGLKKTSTVLDEHEEALRKKLEMISLERKTQQIEHQQDIEKYEKIWASYLKKYEEMPMAKELAQLKESTMKTEASVREVNEKITKIRSQIIELEVEKTRMLEYLQSNPETATESIVKIAGLFVNVQITATTARAKLQELKDAKNTLQSFSQREMKLAENEIENESSIMMQSVDTPQVNAEPVTEDEPQLNNEVPITSGPSLHTYLDVNIRQEMVATTNVACQGIQRSRQLPRIQVLQIQGSQEDSQGQMDPRKQARDPNDGQTRALHFVSTPKTASSNQQNNETAGASNQTFEQAQQPAQETTVVATQASNTPSTTGHVKPVNQSAAGTPVSLSTSRSPLDLSNHVQYIRQVTQSPGEGFMYTGRSMYNSNTQVNHHQQQERNQEKEVPEGVSYEAPLNDQRDMSLNFFQPFETQQEKQDQNLFQENSEQSPARNHGSIFMQASPSNSATSSPYKGFSFGRASPNVGNSTSFLSSGSPKDASSAAAAFSFGNSSSDGGNDFLSSRSPVRALFSQNNNQDNESFGGGFSLFGSSSSPNQNSDDNAGGFSFSFGGGKSPSKSNSTSPGFFLF